MHVCCTLAQARPTMSCICLVYIRESIERNASIIGASLSEPHTSESNSAIVSMYIIMVRTSTESKYKILILRITHYVITYAKRITRSTRTPLRLINCVCTSRQNGSYWKFAGPIGQGTSIKVSFYVAYMAKKG